MVSPNSTLPGDEKEQDSAYNPGEQAYLEGMAQGKTRSEKADDSESVKDAEENPDDTTGGWKSNVGRSPSKTATKFTAKLVAFAKKRGATVGIIGILGLGGGALAGFAGPASMIINLMSNITITNDSSSTALERRFMKVLGYSTNGDPVCANTSKNLKCKMGRISNSALYKLEKKGFVAEFDNDTTNKNKRFGYPSKNPKGYTVEVNGRSAYVTAKDLPGFLVKNPKLASKVLGTGGAFNLRVKAWTGKHITEKFLNPFGIKKNGGLADGENRAATAKERREVAFKKLRETIPGISELDNVVKNVDKKVNDHLGKAKKGGAGYTLAVAGCIAVKAPGYIAAGVAAVQLAQVLPVINDVVLSPGSKLKASGVDTENAATADDMDAIGTILTEQAPRESDGKMSSALNSAILLSAIGINKGRAPVSKSFTPGYSYLTSPIVTEANKANKKSEAACNTILSPAAMYTALAVDSAITIAASATIIGGVIKVGASLIVTEVAAQVVSTVAGDAARQAVTEVASNNKIATAQGEAMGEVLGVSALTFFPSGGMGRYLPGQKVADLEGYAQLQKENEAFHREMDIASLSPFDTSSRYTLLGSIVHNYTMASISSGTYSNNFFAQLSSLAALPFKSLSTSANAAPNFSTESCNYAADFALDTGDPSTTPAINAAGLPCTGITPTQAGMDLETAIELVQNEGWLDESKDFADDATIADLVESGYIVADTPMTDFMESCSNAATGDYLFNSAGCTVNSTTKAPGAANNSLTGNEACANDACSGDEFGDGSAGVKNARALEAISVVLLDFQAHQILNGEDDLDSAQTEVEEEPITSTKSTDEYVYLSSYFDTQPAARTPAEQMKPVMLLGNTKNEFIVSRRTAGQVYTA